ncbi:MAG: hypothetical protein AUI11_03275 [Acidobacteria bacterium 13_2_20CM_2_66_4]|nr:MAG: hypothetical protein AUI11_03275 [Acidobacteria bacterium 13_2_20CM_2_66_4]
MLVAFHVISDALLGVTAFIIAYALRFHTPIVTALIPITRGVPPLQQYIQDLPFVATLVPLGFQLQGLYRLRRGRSRVDDFFAVFVGSILAVVFGIVATLYVQTYFASPETKSRGAFEVSQAVWAIFLVLNVALAYASRELVLGYRGLPLLGTIREAAEISSREGIDHLYVALPPEQHVQMLELIETTSRECVDVKVVPDLLQVIALRARLEDLDGVPVININDVPLQGFNTIVKRGIDVVISSGALALLSIPIGSIALLVKTTSRGPVFYRQERMGLDGKTINIVKFRSMHHEAEKDTGPVWARENDPRVTVLGKFLRKSNLDELPQLWNVLRGDMSIVGPRPERPHFVAQFKHRIPQYMLRHKVKAGLTGWAQVNGWRGNTSIEKRIEYDLYYIENWSVRLDLKIMWLTLLRGFFHKHAY